MWYEKFNFVADPYRGATHPFKLSDNLFTWNRDDLKDKWQFETFIQRVIEGYKVALKVYGEIGSGKTWLLRMIDLSLKEKQKDALSIYIAIDESSPTFDAIYDEFIQNLKPKLEQICISIAKRVGPETPTKEAWSALVLDRNLATCLWQMHSKPETRYYCESWLEGEKLGRKELADLEITTNLDKDYKKSGIMKCLIMVSQFAFSKVVIMVDELGFIRPASAARAFGGILRDLLDSFSENFGLVCSYTATAADDLLDIGYGNWLYTRLEYSVFLEALGLDFVPHWLTAHHKVYRKAKVVNELLPFTEDGIKALIQIMKRDARYPRLIFENCADLASEASRTDKVIDRDFVIQHKERIRETTTQPTLM